MNDDEKESMVPPPESFVGSEALGGENEKTPESTRFPPDKSGNLKGRPRGAKGLKKITEKVANEMHWVIEGGERRRRSTLELVLLSVRNRSLDGNVKAFRIVHQLLAKYGPQEPQKGAGYLIVPEPMTEEEWLEKFGADPPEEEMEGENSPIESLYT